MDAFTSPMRDIFVRILMSERVSAEEWKDTIKQVNLRAAELKKLDRSVKVCIFALKANLS